MSGPRSSSLYGIIPTPGTQQPQYEPPLGILGTAENFSAGMGRGIQNQLIGLLGIATQPKQYLNALWKMGTMHPQEASPMLRNALAGMAGKAMSGPAGLGEVLGENVSMRGLLGVNALSKPGPMGNIVSPDVAKTLTVKDRLPTDASFAQAVTNTPGAEITPDGLKLRIARKQLYEQDGAESVRTGVFYLPEGDKRMRFYDDTKNNYGGPQKFEGETLLRNPLFVKGATGGRAPEMAYETLKGKGAIKKLDDDIFNVVTATAIKRDPALYREMVSDLLSKYGADPSLATYIIGNSTKGNQLKYALRENIIAHAVRDAGYDGVLGHTTTKAGPVFSELFDVREITYPSEYGETAIHQAFGPPP